MSVLIIFLTVDARTYLDDKPRRGVRAGLRDIEDSFDKFVRTTRAILTTLQSEDDKVLPDLRQMFVNLSVHQEEEVKYFSTSMSMVMSKSTVDDICLLATQSKVWSEFNYRFLKRVLEVLIPEDNKIHKKLKKYAKKVEEFKSSTLLRDYMLVRGEGTRGIPGRSFLIAKIDARYSTNFTLANLQEKKDYIADEFKLNEFIFHLRAAGPGCVCITWSIPSNAIRFFTPEAFIGKRIGLKIMELTVDGRFVYKVCMYCKWMT